YSTSAYISADAVRIELFENSAPVVGNQTFALAENSANGTSVGTVAASDPDAGQSLTYAITAGNGSGAFAINPSTGEITVADGTPLDFETTPSFSLTVQVTDNGSPALSTSATITINLTDVDEAPPEPEPLQVVDDGDAGYTTEGIISEKTSLSG